LATEASWSKGAKQPEVLAQFWSLDFGRLDHSNIYKVEYHGKSNNNPKDYKFCHVYNFFNKGDFSIVCEKCLFFCKIKSHIL
jgi:hypothetical protein